MNHPIVSESFTAFPTKGSNRERVRGSKLLMIYVARPKRSYTLIPLILFFNLCGICCAGIFNRTDGSQSLRLNIPDSVETVRGLLIVCNWAGGDVREEATEPEFVAFARRNGLAVLATAFFGNFSQPDDAELLHFESMLSALAVASAHPEIRNVPWMPLGNSNGGQMSYGFAAKRPEKVIAFITSKGCCYNDTSPSEATLAVPGMLIAGEFDTELRRTNIRNLYTNNRARGALWAWVEEEATGHDDHNGQQLKFPFMAECLRLRYPIAGDSSLGFVSLNLLREEDGWLVDQRTWDSGLTEIFPYAAVEGNSLSYGWVPNRKIAQLYQIFSSRGKVADDSQTVSSPVDGLSSVVYAPPVKAGFEWVEMEGFVDGYSLGTVSQGQTPSWTVNFQLGGLYTFYTVVRLPDDSLRTTYLNRVFVDKKVAQSVFENWMYDNISPDDQKPEYVEEDGGPTLLERFAFGLDSTGSTLPRFEFDAERESWEYRFTTRSDIENSGVGVIVETSSNLKDWELRVPDSETGSNSYLLKVFNIEPDSAEFVRTVARAVATE